MVAFALCNSPLLRCPAGHHGTIQFSRSPNDKLKICGVPNRVLLLCTVYPCCYKPLKARDTFQKYSKNHKGRFEWANILKQGSRAKHLILPTVNSYHQQLHWPWLPLTHWTANSFLLLDDLFGLEFSLFSYFSKAWERRREIHISSCRRRDDRSS